MDKSKKSEIKDTILGAVLWIIIIAVICTYCSKSEDTKDSAEVSNTDENSSYTDRSDTADAREDEDVSEQEKVRISYLQWQDDWVNSSNMSVNPFGSERKKLSKWLDKNAGGTLQYVTPKNAFGANQYKLTVQQSNYLYCGDTENNYASGYGMLYVLAEQHYGLLEYNGRYYDLLYIGEFEDGRYSGYGLEFYHPDGNEKNSFECFCKYNQ